MITKTKTNNLFTEIKGTVKLQLKFHANQKL